ncbi:lipopolysaccharide biosynthesis protein [Roseateles sp. BYS87W]|uniref:Lipopolysaccharide biosynthesis protein n=2 Tax=Pelomonas baiyunensis TaxID=3299026 RepID=A0ABW7H3H1_9BURK
MRTTQDILSSAVSDAAARGRRGTLFMAGSRVSGMAVGLLSSAVMGRLLTPDDYGLVAMAMSLMMLLNLLKDFGLTTAVVQHDDLRAEQLDAVFWINLFVALGFAAIGALAAPWIARFYSQPSIEPIVYALCVALLVVSISSTHAAMLRRHLNFQPLMWGEMAAQLAGLVVGVGLGWWTRSYWAIVASQLVSSLATTVVMWVALPWRPGRPAHLKSANALVRFGANLSVFSLLNFFSNQLGAILTGAWLGAGAAGNFNRAQQLLSLSGSTLMGPISQTTLPVLSRLQNDPDGYRQYYYALISRTGLFFGLLGAFVVVAGDAVARLLLGPQWVQAGEMYRWFGMAIFAVGLASQNGNVLMSQGRTTELRHWGLADAGIRAGASGVGIVLGAVGVAAAFGVSTLVVTVPLVFWLIGRNGPLSARGQWASARPGLVCFVLVAASGLLVRSLWWPQAVVAQLALASGLLASGLALACVLDAATRQLVRSTQQALLQFIRRRRNPHNA